MKNNTFNKFKNILCILLFLIILLIFFTLLIKSSDSKLIKEIKKFLEDNIETKVLYISDKENYSDYPIDLLNKYEINYLYVDSTNLNNFEKTKLEKLTNSKYLSNIIIIYQSGKIVDAIIDYSSEERLNEFLQEYSIIPEIISNIDNIIDEVKAGLNSDSLLMYMPYKYNENIEEQDEILVEIADENSLQYKRIDAYLLSDTQQEKLNQLLQVSTVNDQIFILVKNNEIVASIRGYNTKKEYIKLLEENRFINESKNYIKNIDYHEFTNIISNDTKSVITVTKNDCKYCDEVLLTLNAIASSKSINIYKINIDFFDSDLSKEVENYLIELGYNNGFTTPMTIIVESNNLLDYVIGNSNEQYFIDIFTENGIIKKEVQ